LDQMRCRTILRLANRSARSGLRSSAPAATSMPVNDISVAEGTF